jgi:hypothetical protein
LAVRHDTASRSANEGDPSTVEQVTTARLRDAITSGGDERCLVDPATGTNRYFIDPVRFDDLFSRGSCSANTLTRSTYPVAVEFLRQQPDLDFEAVLHNHETRLKTLAGTSCSVDFEVFWGPSGSDLLYLPLLFQKALAPDRPVASLLSCPEELGSGSQFAADGRFFSSRTQLRDRVPNGQRLGPLEGLEVIPLPARDHAGRIAKRRASIEQLLADNRHASRIGNLVYGSKSGIEDDLGIIDDHPDGVMWVVDLCQFRVDPPLIARLLEAGALVMLTGSKFFEAPPFCAALLVPDRWVAQLSQARGANLDPFGALISASDVPAGLVDIRRQLPDHRNWGLRMRWEVALAEMEAFVEFPWHDTESAIAHWNDQVCRHLASTGSFRLIPDQHLTNRSIISFQVLVEGRPLSRGELGELFATLAMTHHDGFVDGPKRAFIGQPVAYGDDAFVRLAVGSSSLRSFLGGTSLDDDHRLVEVVEQTAQSLFG